MIYEKILPSCSYAPWRDDFQFLHFHSLIHSNTLVDIYRCYELWSLTAQTQHILGDIIEVGVWRGGTGALIGKQAELTSNDEVWLFDTFRGVVKSGNDDPYYKDGIHSDTSIKIVEELISNVFKLTNTHIIKGVFPDESDYPVRNKKFRMAHIDVDVYQSARDSAEWVWPRLSQGGIIVYDDYGFQQCVGVTKYVNEQIGMKDRLVIHNLNGHAIVIKTDI